MLWPWKTIPMNSDAPRRTSFRSGGSVSRPSPLSTMYRCTWKVTSGVISVVIGRAQLTVSPSCTRDAACVRLAGVIRFRHPFWSSSPQRPQLLNEVIHSSTWASEGMVLVVMAGLQGFSLGISRRTYITLAARDWSAPL